MSLEHPYGNALTGTIAVSVLDPTVGAYPPPSIVQRDHAWQIQVNWTISGPAALGLGGDWKVRAFLESVGPGYEGQAGPTVTVPLASSPLHSIAPIQQRLVFRQLIQSRALTRAPTG